MTTAGNQTWADLAQRTNDPDWFDAAAILSCYRLRGGLDVVQTVDA